MTAGVGPLGEAELHGLVDGHLAVERRADVLRKLAASPADRALVEAWQEQNDLIRAAFRDVEHEALPVALDLAPPRLRCIEGGMDGGLSRPPLPPLDPPLHASSAGRRTSGLATFAAVLGLGLAGAWLAINPARQDDPPVATPQATTEAALAERAAAALEGESSTATDGSRPPPLRIPDLAAAGLRPTGVSTQGGESASVVLHYRDAHDRRVVLGIAGAADATATPPETIGGTLVWRRGGTTYALAGTLPAERLRTLARSLQNGTGKE